MSTVQSTGKVNYSLNRNLGTFKGLPAGISLSVPSCKGDVKGDVSIEKGTGAVNASANVSVSAGVDATKMIGSLASSSVLRGASFNAALNGTVKATMDDFEPSEIKTDLTASVNAGLSFCMPSGLGGKVIAEVTLASKGTFNEQLIEELEELEYKAMYGDLTEADLKKVPLNVTISLKFYDDNDKVTYTAVETKSLMELYTLAMQYANMLF